MPSSSSSTTLKKPEDNPDHPSPSDEHSPRFPPNEEASLLDSSNVQKTHANTLYAAHSYSQAISEYDKALASCPNYLDYEIAILKANIAACHLQLAEWESAASAATAALDALERLSPTTPPSSKSSEGTAAEKQASANGGGEDSKVVELDAGSDEAATQQALESLSLRDEQSAAIRRLRTKALLRRAKAKSALGGWANLQAAEDDYNTLSPSSSSSSSSSPSPSSAPLALASEQYLSPQDRRVVREALRDLPGRIKECREREMAEMLGKLKEVGNGLLRPFGLSTDMFKVAKDEGGGGGYSMSFDQGR